MLYLISLAKEDLITEQNYPSELNNHDFIILVIFKQNEPSAGIFCASDNSVSPN